MIISLLGTEEKLADGTLNILNACNYVVAVVVGSELPPIINGVLMDTVISVPAQGANKAISVHVTRNPTPTESETQPFSMPIGTGIRVLFIYFRHVVCVRPDKVYGYVTTGSKTGTLPTSTDDYIIGIVLGNNGQVTLKSDTIAMTLWIDESKLRIGYIIPGDTSASIAGTDPGTVSGYWQSQDPIWHEGTLITAGYWETVATYHPPYSYIDVEGYLVNVPGYYTYTYIWHDPVYSSGYWEYPPDIWIATGTTGQVSLIAISLADVMIGGIYVSRPLPA